MTEPFVAIQFGIRPPGDSSFRDTLIEMLANLVDTAKNMTRTLQNLKVQVPDDVHNVEKIICNFEPKVVNREIAKLVGFAKDRVRELTVTVQTFRAERAAARVGSRRLKMARQGLQEAKEGLFKAESGS